MRVYLTPTRICALFLVRFNFSGTEALKIPTDFKTAKIPTLFWKAVIILTDKKGLLQL